ncbi:hypothetical protein [Sphingomonas sp. M1-B02]|uniref:hypothetical protein n=1 Tax=Sphingomonas sp. M1-B02 TaxID=3114300 RepID=UPI002240630E|nr:hypothetical protein [Sphingomonas sp. S6-11]UZK67034.1 hypothetical protein OKW87_04170 [Sphingomonas sp. S6-11]
MTIFRCSVVLAGLLAACSASRTDPPPDPSTPIGKIFEISNFAERSAALKQFADARLSNRAALQTELRTAGFVESRFRNDTGVECQGFRWTDNGSWPVVVLLNICGEEVFANAGQIAP